MDLLPGNYHLTRQLFNPTPEDRLNSFLQHQVVHWNRQSNATLDRDLIGEEPLSIRVQGKPYSVVMRTPGDEIAHVAGFCLGEGIIDTPDDCTSIAFCDGADTNVVTVTLKSSRRDAISETLDRRSYISQTSCGLCGKELVRDLYQVIHPLKDGCKIALTAALGCLDELSEHQPLRRKTRAAHAAVIYNADLTLLAMAEDVGRHNALDKAIGKVFLDRKLGQAALLILSSRISYELVQKAARARIPVILAESRPTALAVELAAELNMTLVSRARGSGLDIFCGAHRLN
ncbi:MAG: formate dehydrogenase accessory sulfurtransferase FdhD [Desulfobacterales bacterium]|nr:MAG: formate dehydrogenase accessory sulfurtransferase FdhD [Desulfobacterales bacterium]